jgi:predicted RNase H-like nuclease (RuvC/YqgF family)
MLRIFTLLTFLLSCSLSFSQSEKVTDGTEKLIRLQQKTDQLNKRILDLEASISALKQESKYNQELLKKEIQGFQEVQAQNERSMNLALDGFTEKFEKQNETVKGVQAELGQKFNNQLLMSALGFVALVVVFLLINRNATAKALSQNVSNWNKFQEHLLKK